MEMFWNIWKTKLKKTVLFQSSCLQLNMQMQLKADQAMNSGRPVDDKPFNNMVTVAFEWHHALDFMLYVGLS